jgi:hypothetical protein
MVQGVGCVGAQVAAACCCCHRRGEALGGRRLFRCLAGRDARCWRAAGHLVPVAPVPSPRPRSLILPFTRSGPPLPACSFAGARNDAVDVLLASKAVEAGLRQHVGPPPLFDPRDDLGRGGRQPAVRRHPTREHHPRVVRPSARCRLARNRADDHFAPRCAPATPGSTCASPIRAGERSSYPTARRAGASFSSRTLPRAESSSTLPSFAAARAKSSSTRASMCVLSASGCRHCRRPEADRSSPFLNLLPPNPLRRLAVSVVPSSRSSGTGSTRQPGIL